ncbi:hypothetical protein [Microbacterium sp. ABRD28]|uniref:hypothetical protein n=1 Tax=Microbacterium sp. ABRD28 TaxID=2268461 RepID=UPI000F55660E|nr:hypothetical protein [Microbacterium sp. ABRD28]AZC13051.1 hypothetical protein DT073_04420 [Microbacterium sp. ABRD28]
MAVERAFAGNERAFAGNEGTLAGNEGTPAGWAVLLSRAPVAGHGSSDARILIRSLQASRGEPQAPRAGASAE